MRTASDISVFEILKIGIGPSSSHTLGPMRAAARFLRQLETMDLPAGCRLHVDLLGSLAATGKGHRTDEAICAGLAGLDPAESDLTAIWGAAKDFRQTGGWSIKNQFLRFQPDEDITWQPVSPPDCPLIHPNTMRFTVYRGETILISMTARSVGGGFIEFDDGPADPDAMASSIRGVPFPFDTATELVKLCDRNRLGAADIAMANEVARGQTEPQVRERLTRIWEVMQQATEAGLQAEGILPGGLNVPRRAARLYRQSLSDRLPLERHADLRASAYAMAVAEHNASGGRVVTAPTNGSAGVLPAVLHEIRAEKSIGLINVQNSLLIAGVIAAIVKRGASISGAEVGCQGEIGTASAMAAAAATGILGGNIHQIEDAAEIAIEHHLGLTCDPIKGLVQIPCIERNAMGTIKALNAAAMALASDGTHMVSLDRALRVMKQTGIDMKEKYRETATGGLAVG